MGEQNIQKVAKKNSGRNYPEITTGITKRNKKATHYNLEIIMLRNAALVQANVQYEQSPYAISLAFLISYR